MDTETLDRIKEILPHRYSKELMNRTGLSKSTVNKAMAGQRECNDVTDAALAWAEEIKLQDIVRKQKFESI